MLLTVRLAGQSDYSDDIAKELEKHVRYLTSEPLGGRAAGSKGEKEAALYFYDCLEKVGVDMIVPPSGQDFFILEGGDTIASQNIIGVVNGYDPILKNQYIVIGANLDYLGYNFVTIDGKRVQTIFPGANDNASGLACILEVARRVAASSYLFPRSVIFAGFGAKEKGMAGSWYFVNKAFAEIDSVSLMVDVREVGLSGSGNEFLYTTCVPNTELYSLIEHLPESGAFFMPKRAEGILRNGDYLAFYERGIPVVSLTTNANAASGAKNDEAGLLDYKTMDYICNFIYKLLVSAANTEQMIARTGVQEVHDEKSVLKTDNTYSPYEVEVAPKFFRGDERTFLTDWVYTYLRYPQTALEQGVSGVVNVEFVIEKDGSVTNVRAVSGNDVDLMEEAVRVVSVSPKWKPGTIGKEKVRVKYTLPVEFRLKKRK